MLAKLLDALAVVQLRQRAMVQQSRGDIVGDGFVARQIAGPLAGDDGGKLVIGQAAPLGAAITCA